ncbi:MAG: RDD family protein [Elusimicrobiales bacterium]|nr:RDD family protein [Elusimicrobiales bacterium]
METPEIVPPSAPAPQRQAAPAVPPPADFAERLLAYLLDGLPFVFATYITLALLVRTGKAAYSGMLEFKLKLVWIALYIVYETVLSSGGRATVGKLALGIRVRAADYGPLGVPRAFLRAIGYFISGALAETGFLMAFLTPGRRALHDYVAGSRVVRVREKSNFAYGLIFALAWGAAGLLASSAYYSLFLMPSKSDIARIQSARNELDRLAYYEELYKKQYGSYTDDIAKLALTSGDVGAFRLDIKGTLSAGDGDFEMGANDDGYFFSARALDRRKTRVVKTGP